MSDLIKFLIDNTEDRGNWHIEANPYKSYYQTAEDAIRECDLYDSFESDEMRKKSIETNSLYYLQWYSKTPVGFYSFSAPTFDDLERYVLEEMNKTEALKSENEYMNEYHNELQKLADTVEYKNRDGVSRRLPTPLGAMEELMEQVETLKAEKDHLVRCCEESSKLERRILEAAKPYVDLPEGKTYTSHYAWEVYYDAHEKLKAENERLREALEYLCIIGDRKQIPTPADILIAKQALQGKEGESDV